MSIQHRSDELVDLLRPDFVGNDGTASPTFTDEYLTGSHRASVSVGVRAFNNGNWLHNNTGNFLAVPFDNERWDDPDNNQHDNVANNSRLTCQFDGIYVISGHLSWDANGVGNRGLEILLNGITSIAESMWYDVGTIGLHTFITTVYKLSVGNFVELMAYQNSGGNLNSFGVANYSREFSMVRAA